MQKLGGEEFMYAYLEELTLLENITLFGRHTVGQLLFDGYDDPIITGAAAMGLHVPPRFGFFFGRNDTVSKRFEVYNGELEIDRLGLLRSYGGEPQLSLWSGDACNRLNQSTTGDLNPPFNEQMPARLRLFAPDLCRCVFPAGPVG